MAGGMTCPNCAAILTEPAMVGILTACGACHRTLAVDGETVRLATGADTANQSAEALTALRTQRARPKVARRFR